MSWADLVGVLATTTSMAAHAAGPGLDVRPADQKPAPNIVLVWDGGGPGGHSGAIDDNSPLAAPGNGRDERTRLTGDKQ